MKPSFSQQYSLYSQVEASKNKVPPQASRHSEQSNTSLAKTLSAQQAFTIGGLSLVSLTGLYLLVGEKVKGLFSQKKPKSNPSPTVAQAIPETVDEQPPKAPKIVWRSRLPKEEVEEEIVEEVAETVTERVKAEIKEIKARLQNTVNTTQETVASVIEPVQKAVQNQVDAGMERQAKAFEWINEKIGKPAGLNILGNEAPSLDIERIKPRVVRLVARVGESIPTSSTGSEALDLFALLMNAVYIEGKKVVKRIKP